MGDRGTVVRLCASLLHLTALLLLLALVAGVRPRVLAQEYGPRASAASSCVLCDGSSTAATVAPAVQAGVPPPAALVLGAQPVPDLSPDRDAGALPLAGVTPPPPPPRA